MLVITFFINNIELIENEELWKYFNICVKIKFDFNVLFLSTSFSNKNGTVFNANEVVLTKKKTIILTFHNYPNNIKHINVNKGFHKKNYIPHCV